METKFEALKKEKKTVELLNQLKILLKESKTNKNYSLALDIFLYEIEIMRFLRMHEEAINLLEEELKKDEFQTNEQRTKLYDELIKTLLRTEDFMKLEYVLMQRERFLINPHQKVMQKFYYAVCYEGLAEYEKAIDSLKSIKDNISSSNLVSKYLKLSMLYLKQKDLENAKNNYYHAIKFDVKKRNPIFYLAESDILYFEGDFENALIKYQEYFIKSKNKRRYLDRYILINIKLDRLDEAWKFYQKYLPTMLNILSKNYRLVFYVAALELARLLKNQQEIEKLEYLIEELKPVPPKLDQFDSVYRLLSIAFQDKHFKKPRDIILHLFRAMDSIYSFQKLLYIIPNEDRFIFYHYQKGLLLEKDINPLHLSETVIEEAINDKLSSELYTYDDLIKYTRSIYKTRDTKYVYINKIERKNELNQFIVYSDKIEQFDTEQKLVLLASEILKKLLRDFDNNFIFKEALDQYKILIEKQNNGFIKIDNNIVHFLNQHSKKIIGVSQEYLAFVNFQKMIKEEIFIDDFLNTEELDLHLVNNNKTIHLDIISSDFTIYAYIKEVKSKEESLYINPLLKIGDEHQLLFDNKEIDSKTIFMLDIRNYFDYLKDYNYLNYKDKLDSIYEFLKLTARQHLDKIYFSNYSKFYLLINNTDKRVINRISDSIIKKFEELDIRISIVIIKNTLTQDILYKLLYLDALTSDSNKVVYDNKNIRYNQELSKTILININHFLDKKLVPLSFISYNNWENNIESMYKVKIAYEAMLGEENSLKRVLISSNLEEEWDMLITNSLIKSIKQKTIVKQFVLTLSSTTINNKNYLNRILKKIREYNIILRINLEETIDLEIIKLIKDKSVSLLGFNISSKLNIKDIDLLKNFDYLCLDTVLIQNKYLKKFLKLIDNTKIIYILDHKNNTVKKSELIAFDIKYLIGNISTIYDNVNAL
ncbi:MAG: hypothetical protein B6I17_00210 [Tenericutes bacterium 4572_104]|nr:MAG: hypothetical protein B6I17_00210 [Tenericutes bacterium 4572_104]